MIFWKFQIFILFLIFIPSNSYPHSILRNFQLPNSEESTNDIQKLENRTHVRVIVSSSSSTSTIGGKRHSFHRTTYHDQVPPSPLPPIQYHLPAFQPHQIPPSISPPTPPPPIQYRPTTYHPLFQHHHQFFLPTLPPLTLPHRSINYINRFSNSRQLNSSPSDIFGSFYRAFTHQSAENFPLPVFPTMTTTEPMLSLGDEPYVSQPDSTYVKLPSTSSEKPTNSEIPEKNWEEPEKVWGSKEEVWGGREVIDDHWESKKENPKPTSTTPSTTTTVTIEEDDEPPIRFYELGEDEEEEPKEIVLDKAAMETTIESAQLAARSWELPELSQLTHVPTQSFVRSTAPADTRETYPILKSNLPVLAKLRMEGSNGKSLSGRILQGIPTRTSSHGNVGTTRLIIPDSSRSYPELSSTGKKFGYVLDGSNVRKYRVEERTQDGYIVGEYGVLNHNNGFLRGVRYTADGTINPRLIHEALMKFLSL